MSKKAHLNTALLLAPLCLFAMAQAAHAKEPKEHLVQTIPAGFTEVSTKSQPGMLIDEYLPANETLQNWKQQILVQHFIFKSGYPPPPSRYVNFLIESWQKGCPGAAKPKVGVGYDASGRPAGAAELDCPKNPTTGKPEHTFFQIIRATAELYVAQYVFRYEPSDAERVKAVDFLRTVHIEGTAPVSGL